jgi:hypothetical protein
MGARALRRAPAVPRSAATEDHRQGDQPDRQPVWCGSRARPTRKPRCNRHHRPCAGQQICLNYCLCSLIAKGVAGSVRSPSPVVIISRQTLPPMTASAPQAFVRIVHLETKIGDLIAPRGPGAIDQTWRASVARQTARGDNFTACLVGGLIQSKALARAIGASLSGSVAFVEGQSLLSFPVAFWATGDAATLGDVPARKAHHRECV